jgi:hypothetical protein
MIGKTLRLIGVRKAETTNGPFEISMRSQVLDTEYTRQEMSNDISERKKELCELKSEIRGHWDVYKKWLQTAQSRDGIDELEAQTEAKEEKKAAKDKEQLYKLLWKELSAMKNAMRKDKQVKIVSGQTYDVSVADLDLPAVEKMAEKYRSQLQKRQRKVEEFEAGVDRMEEEEVEIDFSDIEKDIAELEMQDMDVEFYFDDQTPEMEAEEPEWD